MTHMRMEPYYMYIVYAHACTCMYIMYYTNSWPAFPQLTV